MKGGVYEVKKYKYLQFRERKKLEKMYLRGDRIADIAGVLEVNANTVYNEIKRGFTGNLDINQRREYSPELAQRKIMDGLRRRGPNFSAKAAAEYAARCRSIKKKEGGT